MNVEKMSLLAALLAAGFTGTALADTAETKGGLTVSSDDGRFEFKIGGRLHIDAYAFNEDDSTANTTEGGMFLRRGYVTSSGKLHGWKFKQEFDLASSSSNPQSSWKEAWVSTEALGGEIVIGQFKPYRSMDEMTSSNEMLFMERPYSSASGLYAGRQYQTGVGYKLPFGSGLWATSVVNTHAIGGAANSGIGVSSRLTYTPIREKEAVVHVGISAGSENADRSGPNTMNPTVGAVTIAGRNSGTQVVSPTQAIGSASDSQDTIGLEGAASMGSFFIQTEYARSALKQQAGPDQDVTSYYAALSFFVTGESKPYRAERGTFGAPKPARESGAWELVARYDFIENPDAATQPEVTQVTTGLNWYPNPNVRLMLNYSMGEATTTAPDSRRVDAIAVRTQLSF